MERIENLNLTEVYEDSKKRIEKELKYGRVNVEIASAIIDSMEDVDISKIDREELRSITDKVLNGLSDNVNWFEQVSDIVKDTDEYLKAKGDLELFEDNEEYAEEFFSLDDYFEEDDEEDEEGDEFEEEEAWEEEEEEEEEIEEDF